ncbi:hypothetical protein [Virgibacillus sp. YIM 98842]|uniref:hypothetical protein n=1 Tax=Virgibacillus sp. YIM 98842 TaxID=2663533 RepID=UPI0013DC9A6D|nr:hypothetical protein [Virgibacillus sp. YIM 98842]
MTELLFSKSLGFILDEYYSQLSALESYVASIEELLLERHKSSINREKESITEVQKEISQQLLRKTIERLEREIAKDEVAATKESEEELDNVLQKLQDVEKEIGPRKTTLNADVDFGEGEGYLSVWYHDERTKHRFDNYFNSIEEVRSHTELLYKSSLITLAVNFELLITNILQYRAYNYPASININKKTLTLSEIEKIGSIEEAKNYLVEQHVTDIMRQSNESWIKHIKSNFSITLEKELQDYEKIINEVFNRRNLIVHGGGEVNNIYLTKVDEKLREGIKKGDKIKIDKEYILSSIDIFRVYGLSLMYTCWMSLEKENEERVRIGQEYAFELLRKEKYFLAQLLYKTILKDKLSQEMEYLIKINYWQTFKWQGEFFKVKSEVEEIDFSASKSIYQMCKNLLLDNNTTAIENLESVLISEDYTMMDLLDWPIIQPLYDKEKFQQILEREGINIETVNSSEHP